MKIKIDKRLLLENFDVESFGDGIDHLKDAGHNMYTNLSNVGQKIGNFFNPETSSEAAGIHPYRSGEDLSTKLGGIANKFRNVVDRDGVALQQHEGLINNNAQGIDRLDRVSNIQGNVLNNHGERIDANAATGATNAQGIAANKATGEVNAQAGANNAQGINRLDRVSKLQGNVLNDHGERIDTNTQGMAANKATGIANAQGIATNANNIDNNNLKSNISLGLGGAAAGLAGYNTYKNRNQK